MLRGPSFRGPSFRGGAGIQSTKSAASDKPAAGALVKKAPSFFGLRQSSGSFKRTLSKLAKSMNTVPSTKSMKTSRKKRKTKVIFNWPMPRQEWVDGKFVEHHEKNDEAWVELFIDLIYVVLLSSLSNQLEIGKMSAGLFFKITLSFWIICLTRQAIDEYSNRFYCHDFVQKCIYFVYTIAVLIQAIAIQFDYLQQFGSVDDALSVRGGAYTGPSYVSYATSFFFGQSNENSVAGRLLESLGPPVHKSAVSDSSTTYSSAFALSVLITRICLICIYALVMKHHKEAREQFKFDIIRWTLSSVLMFALIIINICDKGSFAMDLAFFGAVVFLELSLWIISRTMYRHLFKFPVSLETLQARWGVWVMIVIGESVIQLLHSFHDTHDLMPTLIFMGCALLMLFTLAMQYFDACQVEWYEHALTKSALAGVSWIWLHVSMTHYLFRLGLWLKALSDDYASGQEVKKVTSHSFSVALGIVTLLMTVIRMSNSMPDSTMSLVSSIYASEARSVLTLLFRVIVSVIQILVGFVGITNPLYLLLAQVFLTLITTALDVVNEIHTTAMKMKEEEAKVTQGVAIRSLKQFPRQWSRLQLVRKESLLEMNLMSEEGSAKSHASEGDGTGTSTSPHYPRRGNSMSGDQMGSPLFSPAQSSNGVTVVDIDLKKMVEAQMLKQERVAHFDANFNPGPAAHLSAAFNRKPSFTMGSFGSLFANAANRVKPLSTVEEHSDKQGSFCESARSPNCSEDLMHAGTGLPTVYNPNIATKSSAQQSPFMKIGNNNSHSSSGDSFRTNATVNNNNVQDFKSHSMDFKSHSVEFKSNGIEVFVRQGGSGSDDEHGILARAHTQPAKNLDSVKMVSSVDMFEEKDGTEGCGDLFSRPNTTSLHTMSTNSLTNTMRITSGHSENSTYDSVKYASVTDLDSL